MSLKQKIKEINQKLDLSKKYPNYFNKPVLRLFFALGAAFIVALLFMYGAADYVYIECPEGYNIGCENPYIYCQEPYVYSPECEYFSTHECVGLNCDKSTVKGGEYIGNKPPSLLINSNLVFLLIIGTGFLVNHILYKRGKR